MCFAEFFCAQRYIIVDRGGESTGEDGPDCCRSTATIGCVQACAYGTEAGTHGRGLARHMREPLAIRPGHAVHSPHARPCRLRLHAEPQLHTSRACLGAAAPIATSYVCTISTVARTLLYSVYALHVCGTFIGTSHDYVFIC